MRSFALFVVGALLSGCGQASDEESTTFMTVYGQNNAAVMHLVNTPDRGFHFATGDAADPVGNPQEFAQTGFLDFGELAGLESGGTGRFSGSAVRVPSFSGSFASASFTGSTRRGSGFSGSTGSTAGFSGSLSSGSLGACSLTALCDFLSLICELSDDDDCGAELNECVAEINTAPLGADAAPLVCAIVDYVECVSREIRTRGVAGFAFSDPDALCAEFR
ncbi:MAG: hypothetical protein AAFY60_11045, partial [Myxococcota bacterium]